MSKTKDLLEGIEYYKKRVLDLREELYEHIMRTFYSINFGADIQYHSDIINWLESFDKYKPEIIQEKMKHVLTLDGCGYDDMIQIWYNIKHKKNVVKRFIAPRRIIQKIYDEIYR